MEIVIKAPKNIDCGMEQWAAAYSVLDGGAVRFLRIRSRSAIDVIVAKVSEEGRLGIQTNYFISSPNFGSAIPGIPSLEDTFWITEQLINHEVSPPDAVTIASVLHTLGDF